MTRQQQANIELSRWQELKPRYPDTTERFAEMMRSLFAPIPPCQVEYAALERRIAEEMAL